MISVFSTEIALGGLPYAICFKLSRERLSQGVKATEREGYEIG